MIQGKGSRHVDQDLRLYSTVSESGSRNSRAQRADEKKSPPVRFSYNRIDVRN